MKRKFDFRMAIFKAQTRQKQIENNDHIHGLVQAFSHVENNVLNLVLKIAKSLACMKVIEY